MLCGCCEDLRVRAGLCGAVGGCRWDADTATGSAVASLAHVRCAAWVAPVRRLRLARGLCEIGVVWVEVCGFVGMAAVVGRGWQRRERAGRRLHWAERCGLIGLRRGVWGLCGWLVVWCVCWRRAGALVGDLACGAGAPACGGRWVVACAVCSAYAALSDLPVRSALRAIRFGTIGLLGGGGFCVGMGRGCREDARMRLGL
jgi:hypothetical protein